MCILTSLSLLQIAAVIPITLLLVTVMGVFFQRTVTSPTEIAAGMVFAISGLSLFVDALRVVVMPLRCLPAPDLTTNHACDQVSRTPGLPVTRCREGVLLFSCPAQRWSGRSSQPAS